MILETIPDLKRLSTSEKLLLVGELWDDLAAQPDMIPVSSDQLSELDQRMDSYRRNPADVTSWEAIQQRLRGEPPSRD